MHLIHFPRRQGGGVLGISCDGDERRILLGLKFLILGFFWVEKFGKYSFGWLDLSRDSWGILMILAKCSWVYELTYTNIEFVMFKVLRVRNLAWDFLGVDFWSRDFFGFCWKYLNMSH